MGGDVRVSQWGSVPQALEPGARHGQGEHVCVCVVWVHVLKTGNHRAYTKKAWGFRTSGA